ncbi:voltage-gated monoatomic cation channel TMEM109 [Denticeps clupeoides]|uniref:Transmembrane protein 109 n=1 Tax=Denticeps clupeoides TaxID=299321 RepID=A0AAY4A858_9TELE|nr:transmembrane protein 109 [Denticeps clupeoides]
MVGYVVSLILLTFSCTIVPLSSGHSSTSEDFSVPPGTQQNFRSVLTGLHKEAHGFLVGLIGEQAVKTSLQCVTGAVRFLSEGAASILTVFTGHIREFLDVTGIRVQLPFERVTPEGVVYVVQWTLLAVLCYWLLSCLVRLVVRVLRQTLWLLKLCGAVALFALILSDADASAETTAARLAGLVAACALLGVRPAYSKEDHTAHLEEQVRRLEKRLGDLELKRKAE